MNNICRVTGIILKIFLKFSQRRWFVPLDSVARKQDGARPQIYVPHEGAIIMA